MQFEHYTDPETGIQYWWCIDCGDERYGTEIQQQIEANGSFEGRCFDCIQSNFNSTNSNKGEQLMLSEEQHPIQKRNFVEEHNRTTDPETHEQVHDRLYAFLGRDTDVDQEHELLQQWEQELS